MTIKEHKIYSDVSLLPGLGYSGRRITIVEMECKICSYDRLLKVEREYPEHRPDVEYHCRHPNCPEYESAMKIRPATL